MPKIQFLILDDETKQYHVLNSIAFNDDLQDEIPENFIIVKYGQTNWSKGDEFGSFEFSEADANRVIEDFKSRNRDVVFDYEHQTLSGKEAPASGWITNLKKTEIGLLAEVNWTDKAKKYIKSREYRYHSPVIHFDAGKPFRLHSCALTNKPAMFGYDSLVADDGNNSIKNKEQKMKFLIELAKELGVDIAVLDDGKTDEKATAEAVKAKLLQLKAENEAAKKMTEFLKLHDCVSTDELTLKIKGMIPAAEKAELEAKLAKIEADKVVAEAFTDGKLVEAQREWAITLATKDIKAFNDFIEKAPKVAPESAAKIDTANPEKEKEKTEAFTDAELAVFKGMGLSQKDFDDFKKEKEKENE